MARHRRPRAGARRGWWFRNLPNLLTCSRFAFTVAFVWALSVEGMVASWVALGLFTVAALTDGLDGWLARRFGLSTPFGQFMDPLADKVLVLSALLMFLWQNLVPVWMVTIIIAREVIVTSVRSFAESRGRTLPAMPAGKQKMFSQIFAILGTLLVQCLQYTIQRQTGLPYARALPKWSSAWGPALARTMDAAPDALLFLATALTVSSGVIFLHRHRDLFRQS